jgi:hypothetical protein
MTAALIGLAAGVFLVTTVYQLHQAAPLGPVEITAIGINFLLFAAAVTAGGLLSDDM